MKTKIFMILVPLVVIVGLLFIGNCAQLSDSMIDDPNGGDVTGQIVGVVTLSGETVYTGINVLLDGTSYSALTDSSGAYRLDDVATGSYTLVASKTGFSTAEVSLSVTENLTTTVAVVELLVDFPVTNFVATRNSGYDVDLTWTNANQSASVVIRRSISGFPINKTADDSVFTGSGTSHTDTVSTSGTHNYSIFAVDSGNTSTGVTASVFVTLLAPTNFTASRAINDINLDWTNADPSASVTIRRSTTGFPPTTSDGDLVFSGTASTYTDTLSTSGTYNYSIWAISNSLESNSVTDSAAIDLILIGSSGFSPPADYISMAIAPNGSPYVLFFDTDIERAGIQTYNGSSWGSAGITSSLDPDENPMSIAIDTNNNVYIAYSDDNASGAAGVKILNGSSWNDVGSGVSAGAISGGSTSLVIDPDNGDLYLAYRDNANSGGATVRKYNGSIWSTVGDEAFSKGTADFPSLAIDSDDNLYIGFADGSESSGKATVMKYDAIGVTWNVLANSGFSTGVRNFIHSSLVLDSSDDPLTPYYAYIDFGLSNKAVVKYKPDFFLVWLNFGGGAISVGSVRYLKMVIDSQNTLYVGYMLDSTGKIVLRRYNSTTFNWDYITNSVYPVSGSVFAFSLAVGPNDEIYIVFADTSDSNKMTVLKYK